MNNYRVSLRKHLPFDSLVSTMSTLEWEEKGGSQSKGSLGLIIFPEAWVLKTQLLIAKVAF